MKLLAKNFPGNKIRCFLLRCAGYKIGKDVYIGEELIIIDELKDKSRVIIGDRVAIADRVTLVISSWPNNSRIRPYVENIHGKIVIKNDAWLGTGCIVFPNKEIGIGSIIAAGSVVTRDVPDFVVVAGVPAKPIKKLLIEEEIKNISQG